jgi:putative ABC transport system ATP-binding protein
MENIAWNSMMSDLEILRVEKLAKTYGEHESKVNALADINFTINKGETVSIVGASGSGKSTLLHLLGGLDRPSDGKVFVDGEDIYQLSDHDLAVFRRRKIGFVFQFYNLMPVLDVEENIVLPCLLDNRKIDQEYVNDLLRVLGLSNRKNHLPSELSGGQQQRVSIARALINRPTLVLADEPTGNLDTKNSGEVIKLLKFTAQKYNQTLIVITHDNEVARQTDRMITLEDGKIKSDDSVRSTML